MLFRSYDLPDMINRISFCFYHLAKNMGGGGVQRGVRTGDIPDRLNRGGSDPATQAAGHNLSARHLNSILP